MIPRDEAFAKSLPIVRESFDRYADLIARCGPVAVIAQKTRIVIMGRVRFAGAVVRREKFIASFALTRPLADPRLRLQVYTQRWIAHRFDVLTPADLGIPELPASARRTATSACREHCSAISVRVCRQGRRCRSGLRVTSHGPGRRAFDHPHDAHHWLRPARHSRCLAPLLGSLFAGRVQASVAASSLPRTTRSSPASTLRHPAKRSSTSWRRSALGRRWRFPKGR